MNNHPYLQHGLTILRTRLNSRDRRTHGQPASIAQPFLTLSRETCAGATTIGRQLVPLLDDRLGTGGGSWMFLDKDLIQKALSLHRLPESFAQFLPEDRLPEIKGLIGEMVGLHPPLWELEHRVAEAIHKFAQLGRVIIAGRAAHLITRDLPGGFHVRLIAPIDTRIHRAQEIHQLSRKMAENLIHESDTARERHVRTNFDQDINDPHAYDLVINTGRIPGAAAAHLILEAMHGRATVPAP